MARRIALTVRCEIADRLVLYLNEWFEGQWDFDGSACRILIYYLCGDNLKPI